MRGIGFCLRVRIAALALAAGAGLVGCEGPRPCQGDGDCPAPQMCLAATCRNVQVHPTGSGASLVRDGQDLLIATWSPEVGIRLLRSRDGIEWTLLSTPVPAGARSPVLGRNADGQLLLAWSSADEVTPGDDATRLPSASKIRVARSSDEGRSFGEPKTLQVNPMSHGSPHGRIVLQEDGSMLLFADAWYTSNDPLPPDQRGNFAVVLRSLDGGEQWYWPELVAAGYGEPVAARIDDRHLLALVRSPDGDVAISGSFDSGHVWSEPAFYASADPRPADLVRLDDGQLLLTFASRCGASDPALTALVSDDGTGFGLPRRRIFGSAPLAPGLGALSSPTADGKVLTLTDFSTTGAWRYRPAELQEARCAELHAAKHLFLDEELVQETTGVEFHVHAPEKSPEVIIRADKPWETFLTGNFPSVIVEPDKVRLYFQVYDSDYPIRMDFGARLCYAESRNGQPFTKPSLGVVPYHGSTDNNIIYPTDESWLFDGSTIFVDPHGPPEEHYKMVSSGEDGIRGALSADGIHWDRMQGSLLYYSSDTQNVAYWDDELHRYAGFFRGRHGDFNTRNVMRSESADFRHFSKPQLVMRNDDEKDGTFIDLYNSSAGKYAYASHAYLAFPSVYNHKTDTLDVELAVSRDGTHYTRFREPKWVPLGPEGSLDSKAIYQAPGVHREGDRLYVLYNGFDIPHGYPTAMIRNRGMIGRASFRLDGFRSADAETKGTLTTIALTFTGSHLRVNATGRVRAALFGLDGKPLPGLSLEECNPVEGDNLGAEVTWKSASVASAAKRWVKVVFELTGAKLYSFGFVDP